MPLNNQLNLFCGTYHNLGKPSMSNKPLCKEEADWNNATTGDWYGRTKSELYGAWPGRENFLREQREKQEEAARDTLARKDKQTPEAKSPPAYYREILEPELPEAFLRACSARKKVAISDFDNAYVGLFGWSTGSGKSLASVGFEPCLWEEFPASKSERVMAVSIDDIRFAAPCPIDFPLNVEIMLDGHWVLKLPEQIIPANTLHLERKDGKMKGFDAVYLDKRVFNNPSGIHVRITSPLQSSDVPSWFHPSVGNAGDLTISLTLYYKNN
jgi:hypothetical protein